MGTIEKEGFLSKDIEIVINSNVERYGIFFALGKKFNMLGQNALLSLEISKDSLQKLLVAIWFSRILSTFQAFILLSERGMNYEARSLLRIMLEISFSLVATAENKDFCYKYLEDEKIQMRKKQNVYLTLPKEIKVDGDTHDDHIRQLNEKLKQEIIDNNYAKLTTEYIAQEAKMTDHYNTLYVLLCDSVHCRVRDLQSHLMLNNDEEIERIEWGPNISQFENELYAANEILMISIKRVLELFGLDPLFDEFNNCCTEFSELP